MKLYKKLGFLALICFAFYLIGNFVPIKFLTFTVQNQSLRTSEYFQLIVSLFSAFVTLTAVVVALFKEDIRRFWEFPKVSIATPDENLFEDLNSTTSDDNKPLEARKYNCKLEVSNLGNIAALDLEIFLESLQFKGDEYPTLQILSGDMYISWNELKDTKINLSPQGKRTLDIVELIGPTQQSSPGGIDSDIPAKLTIAGIDVNPEFKKGCWTAVFLIFSTNTKPIRFEMAVTWNGRWQKRASEMKNNLSINLNVK